MAARQSNPLEALTLAVCSARQCLSPPGVSIATCVVFCRRITRTGIFVRALAEHHGRTVTAYLGREREESQADTDE